MVGAKPRWILFDLGGVLVEIGGVVATIRSAKGAVKQDPWEAWLRSPAVDDWESGRTSNEDFADSLITELGLETNRDDFLADCATWVLGTFPETLAMLESLRGQAQLACLSNTNPLHWPIIQRQLGLHKQLDRCFLSYELGMAKPAPATFLHVANELACPPNEILFLDDNRLNIEGARAAGLIAERAFAGKAVNEALRRYGFKV